MRFLLAFLLLCSGAQAQQVGVGPAGNFTQVGINSSLGVLDVASTLGTSAAWIRLYGSCGTANPPWTAAADARGLMTCWNKSNSNGETRLTWGTGSGTAANLLFDTWSGSVYTTRATLTATGDFQPTESVKLASKAFASLPTCDGTAEGKMYAVTDSNTAVFNAAIAGGGANHMIAYCDGTSWKAR